jgi:hypothetical protein
VFPKFSRRKQLIRILLFIWQLPQNIIGFLISRFCKSCTKNDNKFYYGNFFNAGISLGNFIIFDKRNIAQPDFERSLKHEKGHQIQSKYLGWLYLIIVGIPSIIRNIYDRIAHEKWSYSKRKNWYYNGFPEKWADKLGGNIS